MYRVEEGGADEAGVETDQDLEDLDLCAVEQVWEVGTERTGAGILSDLPPVLVDRDMFDLCAKCLDPESGYIPWGSPSRRDTDARTPDPRHRTHPDQHTRGMRELGEQAQRFAI